jgi:hypothetical protein
MEATMDARISKDWGWYGSWSAFVDPPTPAQARAERQALADVLAKLDDRLLDDVGLSRHEASTLLRDGKSLRSLVARALKVFG